MHPSRNSETWRLEGAGGRAGFSPAVFGLSESLATMLCHYGGTKHQPRAPGRATPGSQSCVDAGVCAQRGERLAGFGPGACLCLDTQQQLCRRLVHSSSCLPLCGSVAPALPCKISPPTACIGLGGWSSAGCSCGDGATGIVSWRGEKQETEGNWAHNPQRVHFGEEEESTLNLRVSGLLSCFLRN